MPSSRPIRRKGSKSKKPRTLEETAPRKLHVRVKKSRGRTVSSHKWLERQLNDPYVAEARRLGYRSRAAFKLREMDERHHLLKKGGTVVDLGAAPGGWSQISAAKVGPRGKVIGIDLQEIEDMPGVHFEVMDFLDDDAPERLRALVGGGADLVLSDMAASASGHKATDHIKIMALCEVALDFAIQILNPGGHFVAKVLKGGAENKLLHDMRMHFTTVHHAKPKASRQDSAEAYVVALGFKG
jgi:23S rRNA (uridine2552-2'-O)-methyltransferase